MRAKHFGCSPRVERSDCRYNLKTADLEAAGIQHEMHTFRYSRRKVLENALALRRFCLVVLVRVAFVTLLLSSPGLLVATPPVISLMGNPVPTSIENSPAGPLTLFVIDDETPVEGLVLSAQSTDPDLVPATNIVFHGSNYIRTVTVFPMTNRFGTAHITISVTDGEGLTATNGFTLKIYAVNEPPFITVEQTNFVTFPNTAVGTRFTVGDPDGLEGLVVSADSSNPSIVPNELILLTGTGSNRTCVIIPRSGAMPGKATVTLRVADPFLAMASATLLFTLNPGSPLETSPVVNGCGWRYLAEMKTPHQYGTAVAVGDRIYILGGSNRDQFQFEVFHPSINEWQTLPNMPTSRVFLGAAAVGGRIVAIGGVDAGSRVEVFDTTTATWSRGRDLPTPRDRLAAVTVGNTIYAIGGLRTNGNTGVVEAYDVETDNWTPRARMPTPRHGHSAVVVNDKILVIGGYLDSGPTGVVEEYDTATNQWRTKANMPSARGFLGAAVVRGYVYALAGRYNNAPTERYDPVHDHWERVGSFPETFRNRFGIAVINDLIYVVGGESGSGAIPSVARSLLRYDVRAEDPITITSVRLLADGNALIEWNAFPGCTYQLEYNSDLSQPSWVALPEVFYGDGTTFSAIKPFSSDARRFYRVRR